MATRRAELRFHGAAGEVTGSCHELRLGDTSVLLDCGLFQGQHEERNETAFPFAVDRVAAVVLSHAHIDHSGRLPLLVKQGFRGRILAHPATRDLCGILLRDSAGIQEQAAAWESRRRRKRGEAAVEPLYTQADAEAAMELFETLEYGEEGEVTPGLRIRLRDAGHILGSCLVEAWVRTRDGERKVVFSGDLGHVGKPVLRDPETVDEADLVVLESTYGDRMHRTWADTWRELGEILTAADHQQGNVLVPSFAVGRTQQILYAFQRHFREWDLGRWKIYLDSPLAIQATAIYERHEELYDEAALRARAKWGSPFELPNLEYCPSTDDSKALNERRSGAIIVAGSGMCTGGRIIHHLANHASRPGCHLVIVGFQPSGTRGRALVDGARRVRIRGEDVDIQAQVHTVGGLSAHADAAGLAAWYGSFHGRPPVAIVHGEPDPAAALARRLERECRAKEVHVPRSGQRLPL